jgi:hypothetical protein
MFSKAYELVAQFTHPLVVTFRHFDGTIDSGLGAFVVINEDGWLLTAAHNFGAAFAFTQHQAEINAYHQKVADINGSLQLKEQQRKVLLKALKPNPKWITDFAIMLAGQPIAILEHYIYGEHDLALLRVDSNVVKGQQVFPKIINPESIRPGTSLCKFGYPFVDVKATFNTPENKFDLPANLLPVPFFPIEGIYTRNIFMGKTQDQSMDIYYLETSSPGLKGQSGGPICDTEGNIYAIQSQNMTLQLGFKGTIEINKQMVEENQFLNVGIGVHPKTIMTLLQRHNVRFSFA